MESEDRDVGAAALPDPLTEGGGREREPQTIAESRGGVQTGLALDFLGLEGFQAGPFGDDRLSTRVGIK